MKEKLQEYALLAEIISAIVVTLSLIFVGLQIQSNTEASEASTMQAISAVEVEILLASSASPERAAAITEIALNPSQMTDEQLMQGVYALMANFRHWENLYLQYEAGFLSEDAWETRSAVMETAISGPGGRWLLANYSEVFAGPFLEYSKEIIRKADLEDAN